VLREVHGAWRLMREVVCSSCELCNQLKLRRGNEESEIVSTAQGEKRDCTLSIIYSPVVRSSYLQLPSFKVARVDRGHSPHFPNLISRSPSPLTAPVYFKYLSYTSTIPPALIERVPFTFIRLIPLGFSSSSSSLLLLYLTLSNRVPMFKLW